MSRHTHVLTLVMQGPDGSQKRRMKPKCRRSSGSSGSKKLKLNEDDKATPTSTTPSSTSSGGKKRFSRKGREGVKDLKNKVSSPDVFTMLTLSSGQNLCYAIFAAI